MGTASENKRTFTTLYLLSRAELTMSSVFVVSGFLRCRPVSSIQVWNAS